MSSSPPPQPSPPAQSDAIELARTRRSLAATQTKLAVAVGQKRKRNSDTNLGRRVPRTVSLFDSPQTLVEEEDQRLLDADNDVTVDVEEEATEEAVRRRARLHVGYLLLLSRVPEVKTLIEDPACGDELDDCLRKLQIGSKEARRDDLRRINLEVMQWLNADYKPNPPFTKSRQSRGLPNDITGGLLCPITVDWSDQNIRDEIRAGTLTMEDEYFLRAFYPRAQGNPQDVEARFLRSALLVKTYCAIFTSPSSADAIGTEEEEGPAAKKKRTDGEKVVTKKNVAELIGMEGKVTGRSIAHAAVMLAFNLTDSSQWRPSYNGFSYEGLYNFIVDFFEDCPDPVSKKKVNDLLQWWNKQVFPDRIAAEVATSKSTNTLKEQRARQAAAAASAAGAQM